MYGYILHWYTGCPIFICPTSNWNNSKTKNYKSKVFDLIFKLDYFLKTTHSHGLISIQIQGVPFLFVPLQTGITQILKMINAICKRKKTALGWTILLTKFHLSILIIKITTAILVKGDSISKQTWLKAKYETVWYPVSKIIHCS